MVLISGLSIIVSIILFWIERHKQFQMIRPRLNATIIICNQAYYLRIHNSGKFCATNIRVKINNDFISNLPKQDRTEIVFQNLINSEFYIDAEESNNYFIGFYDHVVEAWQNKDVILDISASYCNRYKMKQELHMNHFINKLTFIANDDLTIAVEDLGKIITKTHIEIKNIGNSLHKLISIIKPSNNSDI